MALPKSETAKNKRIWRVIAPGIQSDGFHFRARVVRIVDGKRKEFIRQAGSRAKAQRLLNELLVKLDSGHENIDNDRVTFQQLAKAFSDAHLFAPVYESNAQKAKHEKLAGLAGYKDGIRAMTMFTELFGTRSIRSIKADEIRIWKAARYATKKERGKEGAQQRTLASVNRELSFLSKAFGYAVQKGWLDRNPFTGAKLINIRHEHKRDIALTFAEEKKLLDAAVDYQHLRMLLIFLLDTGLRLGEARKLRRANIKLGIGTRGHIYLPASITKGKEKRDLPVLTPRLREVIEQRFAMISSDPEDLIFGEESVRDAFDVVRERAKLERDIELRDTRHTWISRAVPSGIPLPEAMLYSGHKVVDTFLRYLQPAQAEHNANASRFSEFMIAHEQQQPMASDQVN